MDSIQHLWASQDCYKHNQSLGHDWTGYLSVYLPTCAHSAPSLNVCYCIFLGVAMKGGVGNFVLNRVKQKLK